MEMALPHLTAIQTAGIFYHCSVTDSVLPSSLDRRGQAVYQLACCSEWMDEDAEEELERAILGNA